MASLKLTRENILSGVLHDSARAMLGAGTRFMTAEERHRQIEAIVARAPHPERIWVFGYGSLIWNPAFHYAERRTARVHGYHRQFCLWARAGRGSPEKPGLMLSLERGGSCHGVGYRLHPKHVATELDVVWRREMLTMAYRPVWVALHTPRGLEHGIAFAVNRAHERYVREMGEEATARYLATGAGPLGCCADYLFDTVAHLCELGIRDRRLEALERKVRALMVEAAPPA
ncbi:MAG: gamma-glutamylcyclotransferase [Betaproteobacteria bacterium]|jgi:cation transport protein ChaC|nr:gamma-glutamylcyclotransferase [Betaproteobacteria bacterium]